MSDLYRVNEVPDPSGELQDYFEELIDQSALVRVEPSTPDYEAAAKRRFALLRPEMSWDDLPPTEREHRIERERDIVDAALVGKVVIDAVPSNPEPDHAT